MNRAAVSTVISSGRGELVNVRQRTLLMAKWRVIWVALAFGFVAMVAVLRILFLGAFEGQPARADAFAALNELADRILPAAQGDGE